MVRDREACHAAVHGVIKSPTLLRDWTTTEFLGNGVAGTVACLPNSCFKLQAPCCPLPQRQSHNSYSQFSIIASSSHKTLFWILTVRECFLEISRILFSFLIEKTNLQRSSLLPLPPFCFWLWSGSHLGSTRNFTNKPRTIEQKTGTGLSTPLSSHQTTSATAFSQHCLNW